MTRASVDGPHTYDVDFAGLMMLDSHWGVPSVLSLFALQIFKVKLTSVRTDQPDRSQKTNLI